MMKKTICVCLALMLALTALLSGAAAEEKKRVVTTIFPVYDWVREIAGEKAQDMELTMLLDSGSDLHNFQPTAQDILRIASADLFVYIGGESDGWVEDVLRTAGNQVKTLNLLEALGELAREEETVEGMQGAEEEEEGEEEAPEHDEHIWLSLRNARVLCRAIASALSEIDPDGAAAYAQNLASYDAALSELDRAYAECVDAAAFRTVLFGDRFPFRYLADDYGLAYYAAFSGCSAETEASFNTIVFLAGKVDELGLPAVMTIEHPKARIAETIVSATKEKNQKIVSMDSLQSVTAREVEAGAKYLQIMESNLEALREALN